MQGDLLAGHNNGILRRVELNANGSLEQINFQFFNRDWRQCPWSEL